MLKKKKMTNLKMYASKVHKYFKLCTSGIFCNFNKNMKIYWLEIKIIIFQNKVNLKGTNDFAVRKVALTNTIL